jgi:hypothetical protein
MQKVVLDTGVILGYIRAAGYADYIEKKYAPFTPPNIPLISVVSKARFTLWQNSSAGEAVG